MSNWTIDDPSAHFQIATYTGAGSTVVAVTNDGNSDLQPDFLWLKRRDSAGGNALVDTSRGANVTSGFGPTGYSFVLNSNSTASEVADNTGIMTITSDGFTAKELTYAGGNTNTGDMVAWQWKAAGGTTTNQTGANIDSVTQANTTAGFSIVTYTGNGGTGQSVKHGLGTTPKMIWVKRRNGTGDWFVYTASLGNTKHMHLNTDAAVATTSDFGNYGPDATSFFVNNTGTCVNDETYVAYCFASIQGYSKFDYYTGTGNADGPFVYCGFKPKMVVIRNTTNSGYNWWILDGARNPHNFTDEVMYTNLTAAEYDGSGHATNMGVDLYSNGFKIKTSNTAVNNNGAHNIYMAWAESPFTSSEGVPTTAK